MMKGMTAILLAIELFAVTFIQIPLGIVKEEQTSSSYHDTVFFGLPGDSSNKDLSVSFSNRSPVFSRL